MGNTINRFWVGALMVFVAHNVEETVVIANGWAIYNLPRLSWAVDQWPLFAGAATILTLVVGFIVWNFRLRPEQSAKWLRIFLWIMLLNAIWHIAVSACTKSLAPGVVTAVLLILPFYSLILHRLSHAKHTA